MLNEWKRPLAESEPTPLWYQIALRLRGAIENGDFGPGDALPSEAEINQQFGVSRATSRAALNELEAKGLIIRRSGKGSIVLRKRVDQPVTEMGGFSEDMRRRGLTPSYEVLDLGHQKASAEVAGALELKPGARTFCSYRLLLADGVPIGAAHSWLAPRLFRKRPHPTADDLATGSLYEWLGRHCGVTVKRAREYIEAAAATAEEARILGILEHDPILIARRQSFDGDGKPTEYVILSFRSDRYRFQHEIRH